MADKDGLIRKGFRAAGRGAKRMIKGAVDVGKEAAGEAIGKGVVIPAGEHTKTRLFADKRGRFLTILSGIPAENTQNLWRRYQEAIDDPDETAEDKFVNNISKILGEGPESEQMAKSVLIWMDQLDEETFWQAMTLLDHDLAAQVLRKSWRIVKSVFQTLLSEETRSAVKHNINQLDQRGAAQLDRLIEAMDRNGITRRGR